MPRVLGGFAVFPTGSTLLRDVRNPETRAAIIRLCRIALHELEEGLVDARDDTATELHDRRGMDWPEIAKLFHISHWDKERLLQTKTAPAAIFHGTVRRRARRAA